MQCAKEFVTNLAWIGCGHFIGGLGPAYSSCLRAAGSWWQLSATATAANKRVKDIHTVWEITMVRSAIGVLLLSMMAGAALAGAGDFQVIPEPGILELLALGGVVAAVVGLRNRRK